MSLDQAKAFLAKVREDQSLEHKIHAVQSEDKDADGVPVRVYSAGHPTRTVMYFHGGGFVLGGLNSHDDICAELCAQTGYRIVSVDYRLCPEHLHPAQFQDCWTGTQWAARTFGDPMVLCGDSAGGNLSASIAHHARGRLQGVIGPRGGSLPTPLLLITGDADPGPMAGLRWLRDAGSALGHPLDTLVLPGAGHGFAQPLWAGGANLDAEAIARTWERIEAYLTLRLGGQPPER